jgi:hypothetical protein
MGTSGNVSQPATIRTVAPMGADAAGEPSGTAGVPRVWWWPAAVVVGLSLAVRGGLALAGNGFRTTQLRPSVMHLVEPERLAAHPLAPLWDVHTNPPLFNTGVGVLLGWSPLSDAATFRLVFSLGALVAAVALCEILRALGCRWWLAAPVAALMFAKPGVLAFEYYVAQESFVLPLLYGTLWAVVWYARGPSVRRLGAVLAVATSLVLTRALFSPLWLLGIVVVVVVVRPPPVDRRRVVLVASVPFVLVGAVMVKNEVRFGSFSLSSWMGMNLARVAVAPLGADRVDELVDEGVLSDAARVPPFQPYSAYEPDAGPCDSGHGTPVLDDPTKREGTTNFNAACFVPLYDQALRDSVAAIRHEPGVYARAVGANVVVYLSDDADAGSYGGLGGRLVTTLTGVHDVLGMEVDRSATYPNMWTARHDVALSFVLGLVVATGAGVRSARRRIRGAAAGRDVLVLAVAWTVLSISAVGVLADVAENARFRAPLDPLVIGILVAGVAETVARTVAARRSAVTPAG